MTNSVLTDSEKLVLRDMEIAQLKQHIEHLYVVIEKYQQVCKQQIENHTALVKRMNEKLQS